MGRTINPDTDEHRSKSDRNAKSGGGGHRGPRSSQSRTVLISKALSRLLRHQAENEKIPITKDGWVRLDHVLAWKGLTSRNGVTGGPVTVEEVFEVVEENEKKRFAVRLAKDEKQGEREVEGVVAAKDVGVDQDELMGQPSTTVDGLVTADATRLNEMPSSNGPRTVTEKTESMDLTGDSQDQPADAQETEKNDNETARAITHFRTTSPEPSASEFLIRAVQGHSIKTIASDTALLTPIKLEDPSQIPTTCVHGTFYGSWPAILSSGGLKRMGRNHVHFAEGPTLAELGLDERGEKIDSMQIGDRKEIISGMRRDAQMLIYVDVKAALENEKDMTWWRSENGVILTEGVEVDNAESQSTEQNSTKSDEISETASSSAPASASSSQHPKAQKQHGRGKHAQAAAQSDKMVPMKYWTLVVDAKNSRGVIWRKGEGVVNDKPQSLISKGTPKFRGGGGRGRGRGRS